MKTGAVKLVYSNDNKIPPATANDDSKMEYFALRMEEDKPTETNGPFPSQRAAEDAITEWYASGEWYVVTKVKVVIKQETGRKH